MLFNTTGDLSIALSVSLADIARNVMSRFTVHSVEDEIDGEYTAAERLYIRNTFFNGDYGGSYIKDEIEPANTTILIDDWTLHGDEDGEYEISGEFTEILADFNERIHASFFGGSPIVVAATEGLFLDILVEDTIPMGLDGHIKLGLSNNGYRSVYMPSLSLDEDIATLLQTYKTRGDDIVDIRMDTLHSGETLWVEYSFPMGTEDFDLFLIDNLLERIGDNIEYLPHQFTIVNVPRITDIRLSPRTAVISQSAEIEATIRGHNLAGSEVRLKLISPEGVTIYEADPVIASDNFITTLDQDGNIMNLPEGLYSIEAEVVSRWTIRASDELLVASNDMRILEVGACYGGIVSDTGGTFENSTPITVRAIPDVGFIFEGWYEDDERVDGAGSTYDFTLTSDRTLEARFTQVIPTEGFAGGTGTLDDAYLIDDVNQLIQLANLVNSGQNVRGRHFRLLNSIDLYGLDWTPIGNFDNPFLGFFDGQGNVISNLNIDKPTENYIGLFGVVDDGGITNLGIVNPSITGNIGVGGIVGFLGDDATITNCFTVGGNIQGRSTVGGIAGYATGEIIESRNTSDITGTDTGVGGIAGTSRNQISHSSNTGSIAGREMVGGVVGNHGIGYVVEYSYNEGHVRGNGSSVGGITGFGKGSAVLLSFNTGEISGRVAVGGVAGDIGWIYDSYNWGDVTGVSKVGGLAGRVGVIGGCYNAGRVRGFTNTGGVVGFLNFALFNCYFANSVKRGVGGFSPDVAPQGFITRAVVILFPATANLAHGISSLNSFGNRSRPRAANLGHRFRDVGINQYPRLYWEIDNDFDGNLTVRFEAIVLSDNARGRYGQLLEKTGHPDRGIWTVHYSDSFFNTPSNEYNQALAKASLAATAAAHNSSAPDGILEIFQLNNENSDMPIFYENLVRQTNNLETAQRRVTNIQKFYEDLGFSQIQYHNYGRNIRTGIPHEVAFSFAQKTIDLDGEERTLVAVNLRGATYGTEWGCNFVVGSGNYHYGWNIAANQVLSVLEGYIPDNAKIWVTGFSRSAAVANIVAARLSDVHSMANVYAYTFATPQGTANSATQSLNYNNIFNIVNAADAVPRLALSRWGFRRYGVTKMFPSILRDSDFETRFVRMNEVFRAQRNRQEIFGDSDHTRSTNERGVNQLISLVGFIIPSSRIYENYFQTFLPELMSEVMGGRYPEEVAVFANLPVHHQLAAMILLKTALRPSVMLRLVSVTILVGVFNPHAVQYIFGGGFATNHLPELYIAWMDSYDGNTLFSNGTHGEIVIITPNDSATNQSELIRSMSDEPSIYTLNVNVIVRTSSGEEVLRIIEGDILVERIAAEVYGDTCRFYLPGDEDYIIEIIPLKDGTISYIVSEYEIEDITRIVQQLDISVSEGDAIFGNVYAGNNNYLGGYALNINGELVGSENIFEIGRDDIRPASINLEIEGYGIAMGSAGVAIGQPMIMNAIAFEGSEFIGWYENEELLTSAENYSFIVEQDRNLVAKFGLGEVSDTTSITGVVQTYNTGQETSLKLMIDDIVMYETTIEAADEFGHVEQAFTFEDVEPGIYTLVVTKPAHTSFTLEDIVVTNIGIDLTQDTREEVNLITLTVGDLNGDGQIDAKDLSILTDNFGRAVEELTEPLADLNGDGQVDSRDLSLMLDGFGRYNTIISWR